MEAFAVSEGSTPVCAEGAYMWLAAGRPDKAQELLHTMHGPVLDELPKDVNWLLTLQCALEAALGVGDRVIIETASRLLEPYRGRAVINAGAVMFHGVTDDTLARAAAALGDDATAALRRESALATYTRLGASWWRDRLSRWQPPRPAASSTLRLSPTGDGFWLVGTQSQSVPVKALKGYSYLRELLRRPGLPVAAIELVTAGAGTVEQPGLGSLLDPSALQSYRRRLKDLDADIAEAEDWSDTARRESLETERTTPRGRTHGRHRPWGKGSAPSAPVVNGPVLPPPRRSPRPSTGSPQSTNSSAVTSIAPSTPAPPAPTSPTATVLSNGSSIDRHSVLPVDLVCHRVRLEGAPTAQASPTTTSPPTVEFAKGVTRGISYLTRLQPRPALCPADSALSDAPARSESATAANRRSWVMGTPRAGPRRM